MTDRREKISDALLAEKLFAREREDGVAIHPAVGVRIRQQIEARLGEKRPRSLRWIPAVVAIAGAALFFFLREPQRAPVMESLVRAHQHPIEMELEAGKRAALQRESSLIPGEVPEVLTGNVEFRVEKLPPGESFRVRAGDVIVEVIGTVFTVRRDRDQVEVYVDEGAVRVFHGTADRVVRAGERWSTHPAPEPEPTPEPEPEPEIEKESRAERILNESYRRVLQKTEAKEARPNEPPPIEKPQAVLQPPAEADRQPVMPPEEQRSLLERAAMHLRNGEVEPARAIYRGLAASEPLGLYLLARLEALHAKRPEAALAALDEFLARFPEHALSAEARASRIEALLDLSQCDDAKRALEEFSRRHSETGDLVARSKVRHRSDCAERDERSPPNDH